ncbi:MAG: zinc-ribbon domain-containing protein [Gammaproteobacteria bacterium]|nr:zinc-ribbon domain-containing protein [Gammaproteobacteria bacterium]
MKFCPYCGAKLSSHSRFCVECGINLAITSEEFPFDERVTGSNVTVGDVGILRGNINASTHIDSWTNITGDVNIHMGVQEPSAQEIFEKALTALRLKNYSLAVQLFRQYTAKNLIDADGYYYLALATLQGNRPKLARLSTIRTIEGYLQSATAINKSCSHAFLLWAIVKQDYFIANGIAVTPPPISELISRGRVIEVKHAREIIMHVHAPRNEIWEWLRANL